MHFLLFAPATRLSCTRGSPSRGGIVALTLWPYAACSPDVAWNLPPAPLHSCTWSSRTVRWESHTWPGPWGCAAVVWGCSRALREGGESRARERWRILSGLKNDSNIYVKNVKRLMSWSYCTLPINCSWFLTSFASGCQMWTLTFVFIHLEHDNDASVSMIVVLLTFFIISYIKSINKISLHWFNTDRLRQGREQGGKKKAKRSLQLF